MMQFLRTKLNLPVWLFTAGLFGQLLMLVLNLHLTYRQYNAPKAWSLDSTTYYKFLEGQGRLNLNFYQRQQQHEERLRILDTKRRAQHRRIDSLSGDALQREIDRVYNGQPDSPGTQTNPANRNRSSKSTEGPRRLNHTTGRRDIAGYANQTAAGDDKKSDPNDSATQRAPATAAQRPADGTGPGRPLSPETPRSQVGELGNPNRSRRVRRREAQAILNQLRAEGVTYPDVALAISAVETGYWNWQTAIMKQNNLFAFKANSRKNYQYVAANGYCVFDSHNASIADYAAYERQVIAKYGLRSRADYVQHLGKRFCPNPGYVEKLHLAFQRLSPDVADAH